VAASDATLWQGFAAGWRISVAERFTLSETGGRGAIMIVIKTLWASVQGDPVFMRRVNGWLALFWIAMIPISLETGWVKSVVYVSALSLWALVSGHWSAWQAARVEVNQDLEAKKRSKEDVAQDVVDKIVDDTDVSASP
jgi:hypothetical protein